MTFQIGFRASDGVLLASDLKHTNLNGYRTHHLAPKIKISGNGNLAYCSAGDTDFCFFLEDAVDKAMSNGTAKFTGELMVVQKALSDCLREAQQKDTAYRLQHRMQPTAGGSTFFVFRDGAAVDLWIVNVTGPFPHISTVLEGCYLKAGDANTPAVFFLDRYVEKLPNSVETLVPLAVHTVLMAKALYVEGVEIGIFTRDVFKVLNTKELKPFIEMSKRIDSSAVEEFRKEGRLQ